MGLAIVDNVDVSKLPFEFWVVFRDGQTIKFLPDGMFTLFKKLPADSLRGDEIEQLRRSRMTMLLMHLMHLQGNVHTPESSQTAATTAEIAANAAETQQKMAERQLLKLVQISERLETLLSASHVSDQARTVLPRTDFGVPTCVSRKIAGARFRRRRQRSLRRARVLFGLRGALGELEGKASRHRSRAQSRIAARFPCYGPGQSIRNTAKAKGSRTGSCRIRRPFEEHYASAAAHAPAPGTRFPRFRNGSHSAAAFDGHPVGDNADRLRH